MLSFTLKKPSSEKAMLSNAQAALEPVYGRAVWNAVGSFLQEFQEARERMVEASNAQSVDESVLSRLGHYFVMVKAIEPSLPAKHFRAEFTWTDSLLTKKSMKEASYVIESVSVMFNLGAAYSKLGANADLMSQPGLKTALNYFLLGAGCFEQAKLEAAQLTAPRTIDLTNEYLSLSSNILLAQSYFCMYQFVDKSSYSRLNLSKLTASISRHFANAFELASRPPLLGILGADYSALIKFQQMYYKACSRYWYSFIDREEAEKKGSGYGKVVGRLKSADELLQAAYKTPGLRMNMTEHSREMQGMIGAEIKTAMQILTTIYVEPVVPGEQLSDPDEIANLKPKYPPPTSVFNLEERVQGQEALLALIPPQVLGLQNEYKERLLEQFASTNQDFGAVGEAGRQRLSALNLPHKLDVLKNTARQITEDLWLKVQEVQSRRGVAGLIERLDAINLSSQKVIKQLDTAEKMLQEESAEDEKLRKTYGDRWSRPTSAELLRAQTEELYRFKTKAGQADKINQDLRSRITLRTKGLSLLEKSKGELDALTPSSLAGVIDSRSPVVERLQASLLSLTAIEKDVESLCTAWHNEIDSDTITDELMQVYKGQAGKDAVFAGHFARYQPRIQAMAELKSRLQQTMSEVEAANQEFDKIVTSSGPDPKLEYFKQLEDSVREFNDIAKGVQQGADFYRQLEQRCMENTSKISNTVFARNSEKQELIAKLSSGPSKPASKEPAALPGNPGVPTFASNTGPQAGQQGGYPLAYPPAASTGYQPAQPNFQMPTYPPAPAYGSAPQYPPQPYGQFPPGYPGAAPYGQFQGYSAAPYGGAPVYPPGQYPAQQGYPPQQPGYTPQQGGYPPQGTYPYQQRK